MAVANILVSIMIYKLAIVLLKHYSRILPITYAQVFLHNASITILLSANVTCLLFCYTVVPIQHDIS